MEKKLLSSFLIVLCFGFYSCSFFEEDDSSGSSDTTSSSDTTDEEYAGVWYTDYTDATYGDGVMIYDLKDSSFSIYLYFYSLGFNIEVERGTLTKLSDTQVEYQATYEYDFSTLSLVASDEASRTVDYSLSSDGSTLVFDGTTFSDTDPR
ncbi:MAG: hypothetical protein PQJ60_05220 [Spirochaetales bacterium]|nr:hypothetical protein [Spirochaetales bacterium]